MVGEVRDMEAVDGGELLDAARTGDAKAAAGLISAYLPYWMATARRIIQHDGRSRIAAGPREEPADLVQEALAKLLESWREGKGPATNPRSYVATIMQHTYANRLRSPRTRERPLDEAEIDLAFSVTDDVRSADLSGELETMRRALRELSPEYRAVLIAVTVEGRRPAELTERFGRSAPAISNMLSRAKQSLSRQMLIEYLSDGGPDCAANADRLPLKVHEQIAAHGASDRGLAHVRQCERCRRNWARFGAVSSALGVLPLVTIAQLSGDVMPAAAIDGGEHISGDPGSGNADAHTGSASAPVASVHASTVSAAAAAPTFGKFAAALGTKTAAVVGVVLVALAALAPIAHAVFGAREADEVVYEGEMLDAHPHGVHFDLSLEKDVDGALQAIAVDFAMRDAEEWALEHLTLGLSLGTEFVSASNGLACDAVGGEVLCLPTERTRLGDTFRFEVENPVPGGAFTLHVAGRAGAGSSVGTATGSW